MNFFDSISAAAVIGALLSFGQLQTSRAKLRIELSNPRNEAYRRMCRAKEALYSEICLINCSNDVDSLKSLKEFWSAKDEMDRLFGQDVSEVMKSLEGMIHELVTAKEDTVVYEKYDLIKFENWANLSSKFCIELPAKLDAIVKKYVSLPNRFALT